MMTVSRPAMDDDCGQIEEIAGDLGWMLLSRSIPGQQGWHKSVIYHTSQFFKEASNPLSTILTVKE